MSGKREKILRTALALFAKFGYKKTSVDDIANQSDVAKGTVYLYFKNKEDILINVFRGFGQSYFEMMNKKLPKAGDPVETIKTYLHTVVSFHTKNAQLVEMSYERHLEMEKLTNERTEVGNVFRDIVNKDQLLLEELLQRGIDSGQLEIKDVHATANTIRKALESIIHPHFLDDHSIEKEHLTATLTDMIINGLRKR